MSNNDIVINPFIKWVGGKRHVIKKFLWEYIPKSFNTYFEPFLGGGAMLFYLKPKKAIINDVNDELINTYICIKDNPRKLMKSLDNHFLNHSREYYYHIRNKQESNIIEKSSRFIYLNRTCFNGIYRVNSNNVFNVPFNNKSKDNLVLYSKENIMNMSNYLNSNKIDINCGGFDEILSLAEQNDFVFCDPPYDYDDVKSFDLYNKNSFGKNGQIKLFQMLYRLDKKGVKWMLTNHNTKLINELYKNFRIIPIHTNRNINSDGKKRKNSGNEVIILNYEQ